MNDGLALIDTDAGKEVNKQYIELRKEHEQELREVKREMKKAAEESKTRAKLHEPCAYRANTSRRRQIRTGGKHEGALRRATRGNVSQHQAARKAHDQEA